MNRLLKLLLGVVVGFAALMLLSGLAIRAMVSGSGKDAVLAALESRLKAPVSIEGGDFDLARWFRFTPAITLWGFAVGNPEGFSDGKMVAAEEVSAEVSLWSLFTDRIEVHSLVLRRAQLSMETNAEGRSNITALLPSSSQPEQAEDQALAGALPTELAVHGLYLEDGTVRYLGAGGGEPLTVEGIELQLTDFAPDTSCRFTLRGRLFGGEHCPMQFGGSVGPFSDSSIPAKGDLQLEISTAEAPAGIRDRYFGTLLGDPGGSRVNLSAQVEGDLFAALQGAGELAFVEFQIGPDAQNRLPLEGRAPLQLNAQRLLGEPAIHLTAAGSSLQLGSGQWQGNMEFHVAKSQLKGYLNGAIRGVDINQLLNAFTEAKDKVFGTAEIPDLQVTFAGSHSEELLDSLSGRGTITMEDGRIAALDIFNAVATQAQKLLSGETAGSGNTEFIRFFSRWQLGNRHLQMSDILLDAGSAGLSGEGFVTFEHALNFDLRTTITGPLALNLGGKPDKEGVPAAQIPVKVSGTLEAPRVRPDIKQAAQEQVKDRVTDLLDSFFKKRSGGTEPQP
jgi:uncharacterized protein involved in outer membrane biogenesis